MKKWLNSLFLSLLFCFGLFMGFGSYDVSASTKSLSDVLTENGYPSLPEGYTPTYSYYSIYFAYVTQPNQTILVLSDTPLTLFDEYIVGSTSQFNYDLLELRGNGSYWGIYNSHYTVSRTLENGQTAYGISQTYSYLRLVSSGSVNGSGSGSNLSYNSELGYLKNIKCDNQTTTFTNGGKEWTNVISYDQLTSTGFDVTTQGASVEYFFILSGTYGGSFGLGGSNNMTPYTSQAYSTTGTSFTYNSDLWRTMYEDWISQNNLSSIDRVKEAHLTIAAHVVYNGSFGDWVKINEDGSSYLITSSQPFEGTNSPNDISTSIGSSSYVPNTQNGNVVNTWEQISSGDIDYSEIQKSVKGLSGLIGDIPAMISTLFSWLPSWVLTFLASCIALWGVIALIKLLRG